MGESQFVPAFAFFSQYVMPSSPYITVSGGQALLGLLAGAEPPVQPAKAEVAMRHERAHLELGG